MTPDVHVLLVSAQAAPNLLPVLDPALKPAEAVLLVTGKMRAQGDALERVLRQTGVRTDRVELANEHDFESLKHVMEELAVPRLDQSIALNVTGGTKLMALAAQAIAKSAGWSVFYVDADTDQVIWLDQPGREPHKLTEQLRLTHYLMGYGFELPEGAQILQTSRQQAALIDTLISQIGSLEEALGQLNWLAQQAEDQNDLAVTLDARQRDSRSLEALLRHFEDAHVLRFTDRGLAFTDESQRAFAKGGWLEHYVFRTASRLGSELGWRDIAANLQVKSVNDGVNNELDIAFLARNRLFVIECKTARMNNPKSSKANDTLFKLSEICRRVGGLGTRGLLASYRPMREAEVRLAGALNIDLVCGRDLQRLGEKLKAWVR